MAQAPLASPSDLGDFLDETIAQDEETREVLMLAWMDEEALSRTLRTGKAIEYDAAAARIPNVPEADALLRQPYHNGWTLA